MIRPFAFRYHDTLQRQHEQQQDSPDYNKSFFSVYLFLTSLSLLTNHIIPDSLTLPYFDRTRFLLHLPTDSHAIRHTYTSLHNHQYHIIHLPAPTYKFLLKNTLLDCTKPPSYFQLQYLKRKRLLSNH